MSISVPENPMYSHKRLILAPFELTTLRLWVLVVILDKSLRYSSNDQLRWWRTHGGNLTLNHGR